MVHLAMFKMDREILRLVAQVCNNRCNVVNNVGVGIYVAIHQGILLRDRY